EECPPAQAQALGVDRGRIAREMIRAMMHGLERNRRELAVGRRVELDRESRAIGVVAVAHGEVLGLVANPDRTLIRAAMARLRVVVQPKHLAALSLIYGTS